MSIRLTPPGNTRVDAGRYPSALNRRSEGQGEWLNCSEPVPAGSQAGEPAAAEQLDTAPLADNHGPGSTGSSGGVQLQRPRPGIMEIRTCFARRSSARRWAGTADDGEDPLLRRDHLTPSGRRLLYPRTRLQTTIIRDGRSLRDHGRLVDDRGAAPEGDILHRHGAVRFPRPEADPPSVHKHDHRAMNSHRPDVCAICRADHIRSRAQPRRFHRVMVPATTMPRGRRRVALAQARLRAGAHPPLHALVGQCGGRPRTDGRARAFFFWFFFFVFFFLLFFFFVVFFFFCFWFFFFVVLFFWVCFFFFFFFFFVGLGGVVCVVWVCFWVVFLWCCLCCLVGCGGVCFVVVFLVCFWVCFFLWCLFFVFWFCLLGCLVVWVLVCLVWLWGFVLCFGFCICLFLLFWFFLFLVFCFFVFFCFFFLFVLGFLFFFFFFVFFFFCLFLVLWFVVGFFFFYVFFCFWVCVFIFFFFL